MALRAVTWVLFLFIREGMPQCIDDVSAFIQSAIQVRESPEKTSIAASSNFTNENLCGCGSCELKFTDSGEFLRAKMNGLTCDIVKTVLQGSQLSISNGEPCQSLMNKLIGAEI